MCYLVCGDQTPQRLALTQRLGSGVRVFGSTEQPCHPGGVGSSGRHGVDADPLSGVVGSHGQGECEDRALAGAVKGPLLDADKGDCRAGVDYRGVR